MRIEFACIVFILLLVSCNKKPVETKPVIENITESVYASGIVKTKNQYQVFSTVSGIINKLYVTEGDVVKVGSPILLISDKATEISRQNASLAAEFADVKVNTEKLTEAKNNIALAAAKYQNDTLLFKRQQNLWSQGIGSRFDLEQRELACKIQKQL